MIKIVSINIECDMHYSTILPFLSSCDADVICLQEVLEKDLPLYEDATKMKAFFKPQHYDRSFLNKNDTNLYKIGVAIFAKDYLETKFEYIVGNKDEISLFEFKNSENESNITNVVLLWSSVLDRDGNEYRIATTHFTWTFEGLSTKYQKEHAKKLISVLDEKLKDFILIGDLNAPRGFGTFEMLSEKYKDNIPLEYDSSIDPKLHRVPGLLRMVDGLFSTPEYLVSDVKLVEGISDHKAVVANVAKIS